MDELLRILARKPGDQEALFLASIVFGSVAHTEHLTAVEPLTKRYTYDRRLDPLWVLCSKCGTTWVPSSLHMGPLAHSQITLMNPIGMQCQTCGYTLCRECLKKKKIGVGAALYQSPCPYCPGQELRAPVHPTGRPPAQFERRSEPITAAFLFREGPIPPDREYMRSFFDARSPDVLDDECPVIPIAVGAWPQEPEVYARAYLFDLVQKGALAKELLDTVESGTVVDDEHGARLHLVKLYRRASTRLGQQERRAMTPAISSTTQAAHANAERSADDNAWFIGGARVKLAITRAAVQRCAKEGTTPIDVATIILAIERKDESEFVETSSGTFQLSTYVRAELESLHVYEGNDQREVVVTDRPIRGESKYKYLGRIDVKGYACGKCLALGRDMARLHV